MASNHPGTGPSASTAASPWSNDSSDIKQLLRQLPLIPLRRESFRHELVVIIQWYNEDRARTTLGGQTPNEVYAGRFPAHRPPRTVLSRPHSWLTAQDFEIHPNLKNWQTRMALLLVR